MKKSLIFIISLSLIFSSMGFAPLHAPTIYYVSTSGNDQNFGTQASPWRSIQKCAHVANIGDTCKILAGTYNENIVVTRPSITFEAVGKVVIKQFYVNKAADITVIGFYSKDSTAMAGAFLTTGQRTKFIKNIADGACRAGIVAEAPGYVIDGNEVFGSLQCGTSGPDADGIRALARDGIIINNYIHDIVKTATVNATAHVDCIQGDFGSHEFINILIQGNICDVADAGIQTDGNQCDDVQIIGNKIRAARPLNMGCSNVTIEDNIFYGPSNVAGKSAFVSVRPGSFEIIFKDNIICNTSDGFLTSSDAVPDNGGGGNNFYNIWGTAPRRDSGYSYENGRVRFPTDKWQTLDPQVCGSFVPPVPTATPTGSTNTPTATKTKTPTPTITITRTPTITKTPTGSPTSTLTVIPPSATNTRTSTVENSQTPTVNTPTATQSLTQTVTKTRTPSQTPSLTTTPTYTQTPEPSTFTPEVKTLTPSPTRTPTRVPTATPTPQPNRCDRNGDGRVSFFEWLVCRFAR